MRITALEEYGFRCMLLLANCGRGETLTLPDFKLKEGLSIPYSAKLLQILKKAGLVKSVRGRKGGYQLAREPEKIILRDIFRALGEPAFSSTHCDKHGGLYDICVHAEDCKVREIWKTFDSFMGQLLDRITLADVANGKLEILETAQLTVGGYQGRQENGVAPSNG